MRQVAQTVRKVPLLVIGARWLWRLARPKFSMGVVGVMFNESGEVLMVEHVFHPYLPWGLPGGWVERHEDPAATLRRELLEELALDADIGHILAVENVTGTHVDLAYLCYPRSGIGTLSYELLAYRWIDPTQLPPTHNFHRAAIQRAQQLNQFEDLST